MGHVRRSSGCDHRRRGDAHFNNHTLSPEQIANDTITKQGKELQEQREKLEKWAETLRSQQWGYQHAFGHSLEVDRHETFKNPKFKLLVRFYDSDNCLLVVRQPQDS